MSAKSERKREIISGCRRTSQVRPAALSILIAIFVNGGCRESLPTFPVTRVTGASMSPTIWGDHALVGCPGCRIRWRVNWQPDQRPRRAIRCWNCGDEVAIDAAVEHRGEAIAVDVRAYETGSPALDDIVVIQGSTGVRIKRVVAVAGQCLSSQDGILYRDQSRLLTSAPGMVVHEDSYRRDGDSWWRSTDQAGWIQTSDGFQGIADTDAAVSPTLIYGHRSAYSPTMRPDRVRDDYPGNLAESRRLRAIDDLAVQVDLEVIEPTTLVWWIWRHGALSSEGIDLPTGKQHLEVCWKNTVGVADATPATLPDLDAEHPVAVVLERGAVKLRNLVITRPILYWIDESGPKSIELPLTVPPGHVFVIGDNVPLSIDSRQDGPIPNSQIVGRVAFERRATDRRSWCELTTTQ